MSQTFHKLFRTRLARGYWRDKERPILINNWEATYFDFNEDTIVEIAKSAKKAGIEMFVLDDGKILLALNAIEIPLDEFP